MRREEQFRKASQDGRRSESRTMPVRPAGQRPGRRSPAAGRMPKGKMRKSRGLSLAASFDDRRHAGLPMANPEMYRPLKKPITLRLDADVLAWFKKDGRRYQTRINQALRQVMQREMKRSAG